MSIPTSSRCGSRPQTEGGQGRWGRAVARQRAGPCDAQPRPDVCSALGEPHPPGVAHGAVVGRAHSGASGLGVQEVPPFPGVLTTAARMASARMRSMPAATRTASALALSAAGPTSIAVTTLVPQRQTALDVALTQSSCVSLALGALHRPAGVVPAQAAHADLHPKCGQARPLSGSPIGLRGRPWVSLPRARSRMRAFARGGLPQKLRVRASSSSFTEKSPVSPAADDAGGGQPGAAATAVPGRTRRRRPAPRRRRSRAR